jgi:hypothetical protein
MAHATRLAQLRDQTGDGGRVAKAAVLNRSGDTGQSLHDHTTSTYIKVSDFGISHLPIGQANIASRRAEKIMRAI